jgi:hypothetical protein
LRTKTPFSRCGALWLNRMRKRSHSAQASGWQSSGVCSRRIGNLLEGTAGFGALSGLLEAAAHGSAGDGRPQDVEHGECEEGEEEGEPHEQGRPHRLFDPQALEEAFELADRFA